MTLTNNKKKETHQDYVDGYMDGRDLNTPEPSGNRSLRYKHSFHIGRCEELNKQVPSYHESMENVAAIEKIEGAA